jgi:hypothetical protein
MEIYAEGTHEEPLGTLERLVGAVGKAHMTTVSEQIGLLDISEDLDAGIEVNSAGTTTSTAATPTCWGT